MATTFIEPVVVTPSSTGWQDVNVSSYIPSGASGVMVLARNTGAGGVLMGLRKKGSTDTGTAALQAGYQQWMAIGVDTNRVFQASIANVTDCSLTLIGYFGSEAVFLTNAVNKTPANLNQWNDISIASDTGTDTATAAIFSVFAGSNAYQYNMRKKGSTDNRVTVGFCQRNATHIVGTDASEVCQSYADNAGLSFYLVGYLKDGVTMLDNATDVSLSATNAWTDLAALPSGATGGIIELHAAGSGGLRTKGSTREDYATIRRQTALVGADANRLIEGKISSTNLDFFLTGYFRAPTAPTLTLAAPTSVTNVGCTLSWSQTVPSSQVYTNVKVYRSQTQGFTPGAGNLLTTITNAATTSYVDNTADCSATYYYKVVLTTDMTSGTSNEVSATTLPTVLTLTCDAPTTVTLTALPQATTGVLTCDAPTTVDLFRTGQGVLVYDAPTTVNLYKLTWFDINVDAYGIPLAPTALNAVPDVGHIDLSWTDAASNETGFTVERKLNDGAPFFFCRPGVETAITAMAVKNGKLYVIESSDVDYYPQKTKVWKVDLTTGASSLVVEIPSQSLVYMLVDGDNIIIPTEDINTTYAGGSNTLQAHYIVDTLTDRVTSYRNVPLAQHLRDTRHVNGHWYMSTSDQVAGDLIQWTTSLDVAPTTILTCGASEVFTTFGSIDNTLIIGGGPNSDRGFFTFTGNGADKAFHKIGTQSTIRNVLKYEKHLNAYWVGVTAISGQSCLYKASTLTGTYTAVPGFSDTDPNFTSFGSFCEFGGRLYVSYHTGAESGRRNTIVKSTADGVTWRTDATFTGGNVPGGDSGFIGFCGYLPMATDGKTLFIGNTNSDGIYGYAPWTQIADLPANTAAFADTSAIQGKSHTYRVSAYNASGSAASNEASTVNNPKDLPDATVDGTSTVTSDSLTLWERLIDLPSNSTSYVDSTVQMGQTYQYRIVAHDGSGMLGEYVLSSNVTVQAVAKTAQVTASGTVKETRSTSVQASGTVKEAKTAQLTASGIVRDPQTVLTFVQATGIVLENRTTSVVAGGQVVLRQSLALTVGGSVSERRTLGVTSGGTVKEGKTMAVSATGRVVSREGTIYYADCPCTCTIEEVMYSADVVGR